MKRNRLYVPFLLIACTQLPASAQLSVFGPAAEMLQNSTSNTFSIPNPNYWWDAHGLDVLTDGYLRTRQDSYRQKMKSLLLGIKNMNGNVYPNYFYDDMEWLGISSLRAYEETKDADYLSAATILWADIQGGYSNGAISWNKGCNSCKNTCANTPAIILGARLYRLQHNAADLQRVKDIYTFVKNKLVDPLTGAVWDATDLSTGETNKAWIFSYNLGTYIGAGWELYKLTGDITYLNDAVKTADYVVNNRLTNGVLFIDETGGGDGGLFKGIFVRYFTLLTREGALPAATRAHYTNIIKFNAHTLVSRGINNSNKLVSPVWTTAPGSSTDYSTQLSGVMLLEAAATLDQAFFYGDVNYGAASAGLPAGSYTTAALLVKGIVDNSISALTVPDGYQVTLYENDNFTGAGIVRTGNVSWIGADWNDRVSSLTLQPTATAAATCYQHCGFDPSGYAISLDAGSYTQSQLAAKGIANNDISSLWVKTGYEVVLYSNDNFTGNTQIIAADDACLVDNNFNDTTTSLVVRAAVASIYLQAEDYSSMSGVQTEATTDEGGGSNVAYIDAADWMAYNNIVFPKTGTYTVEYRVASVSGGRLSLDLNASIVQLGTLDIPATGGWQNWTTISHTVTVNAGTYAVGVYAQTGGWNVNWLRITPASATARVAQTPVAAAISPVTGNEQPAVYPNPVHQQLTIAGYNIAGSRIHITGITGKTVLTLKPAGKTIDVSTLAPGVYALEIIHSGKRIVRRFIKQ